MHNLKPECISRQNLPSLFIYQTGQYLYPISDQNGPKTISFGAMYTRAFVFKGVCDGRGGEELDQKEIKCIIPVTNLNPNYLLFQLVVILHLQIN